MEYPDRGLEDFFPKSFADYEERSYGIGEPEKKIEMKCIKCGYKDKV